MTKNNKNKNTPKVKEFKSFDEMMSELSGLTLKDAKKLSIKDPDLNEMLKKELEDDGCHAYIYACYPNDALVRAFAETNGLNIITYSIEDGDEGSSYCYTTGMHYVNRERYYFCRSDAEASCCEYEEMDDELADEKFDAAFSDADGHDEDE